jgi:hypothetical protein
MALRERRPESRSVTRVEKAYVDAVERAYYTEPVGSATSREVFLVLYPGDDPISYTGEQKLTRVIRTLKSLAERDLIDGAWVADYSRYEWWPA